VQKPGLTKTEEPMVYEISYQSKRDAHNPHSEFTHSFFIESESEPDTEKVVKAVTKYSKGDFARETIKIEECPEVDATEMKKHSPFVKLD
jgi:DNA-dependent RNA polymerase auxiliary subunit epsilon